MATGVTGGDSPTFSRWWMSGSENFRLGIFEVGVPSRCDTLTFFASRFARFKLQVSLSITHNVFLISLQTLFLLRMFHKIQGSTDGRKSFSCRKKENIRQNGVESKFT